MSQKTTIIFKIKNFQMMIIYNLKIINKLIKIKIIIYSYKKITIIQIRIKMFQLAF
jgi:hypothetical protein